METVNISRSILICNIFQFFFASAKACLLPFLTLFFRLLGLNAVETGIIMAAKTLTGFAWAPIWARCAIAYNKRRIVLIFSLLIMATTYIAMTIVYNQISDKRFSCNRTIYHNSSVIKVAVNVSSANVSDVLSEDSFTDTYEFSNTTPSVFTSTSNRTTHSASSTSTTEASDKFNAFISKYNLSESDMQKLLKAYQAHKIGEMSDADLYNLVNKLINTSRMNSREVDGILSYLEDEDFRGRAIAKRDVMRTWTDVKDKMKRLVKELKEKEFELFLIILLLVVLGEFLSSPVEKVADDAWFDFLDRIDDIEKYGKQRLSGSIAFIFVPVIITLVVDFTECILPYNIHHFLIHFYMFAAFIGLTVIVAFFYPIPIPGKQKYVSKVGQGMRIVCCDCRSFLYVVTLLILGMVYASFNNFLFWLIQDLGGKEVTMGLCVTIGAFAEIPTLLFSGRMVRKLGNAGVVAISVLAMGVRVLYYSFLWNPWLVLPAELLHAFTHTAMWYAVLSYEDYNVGPVVDRSIRSILSSVYFGVGFAFGSMISGIVLEIFGSTVLYWAASAICGAWSVIFFAVQKCIPQKERIRYIRLLPGEDGLDSGGDEEDWLEMALKEQ